MVAYRCHWAGKIEEDSGHQGTLAVINAPTPNITACGGYMEVDRGKWSTRSEWSRCMA